MTSAREVPERHSSMAIRRATVSSHERAERSDWSRTFGWRQARSRVSCTTSSAWARSPLVSSSA